MSHSQNGWPVTGAGAQDTAPLIGAITVPNGVLKGDVAWVFRWLAGQYNAHVEPLVKGSCWGWYVKPIEGSTTISNHASGTAVDFNADQHPMGVGAAHNFTSAQIAACRKIVKAAGGVLRWGGDYTGRPDPMHWEINASAAAVRSWVTTMKKEAESMALTATDGKTLWSTDVIPNPGFRSDSPEHTPPGTNETTTAFYAVGDIWERVGALQATVDSLRADVAKLVAALPPAGA